MDELRVHAEQLEDDAREQKTALRQQQLKFEEEVHNMQKHYEEKMAWMLREIDALKKKVSRKSLNDTFVIESNRGVEEAMADTMEHLRDELENYKQQCEELQKQLEEKGEKPKTAPKIPKSESRFSDQQFSDVEYIDETEDSDDEDDLDNSTLDPEWRKTPLSKRTKRTSALIRSTFAIPDIPAKRKTSEGPSKCACKGNCGTKLCSCKKRGDACGENCKCDSIKCVNKQVKEESEDGDSDQGQNSEQNTSRKHNLEAARNLDATFDVDVTPQKKPK